MIPIFFCNQPNVFKVLILVNLIQLFFVSSSCLQDLQINRSTISIPQYTHRNSNSTSSPMPVNPQKQLRRLPHVFSKVLELPLRSDAHVSIEDISDCYKFTANIEDNAFSGKVRAHAVKIHPEVTKVVVRGGNGGGEVELLLDKLRLMCGDLGFRRPHDRSWRQRLWKEESSLLWCQREAEAAMAARLKVTVAEGGLCLYSKQSAKVIDGR